MQETNILTLKRIRQTTEYLCGWSSMPFYATWFEMGKKDRCFDMLGRMSNWVSNPLLPKVIWLN